MWIKDVEKQFINKSIGDTSDNMTLCIKCLKLKWSEDNDYCTPCTAWFHRSCGSQKNKKSFQCPLCGLVEKPDSKKAKKSRRPQQKRKK